jgi:hypothetical protein
MPTITPNLAHELFSKLDGWAVDTKRNTLFQAKTIAFATRINSPSTW